MKLPVKIASVFLISALLTSCVAAIENKDLPTKEEITDFIADIQVSDNYIITVFNTVIDKHPAWNCDIWKDKNGNQLLSLYYVDPGSAKGYDGIYFNELGKEISKDGVEIVPVPVKSHVGKDVSKENTPVSTTPVDTTPVSTTPIDTTSVTTRESIQEQSVTAQEQRVTAQEPANISQEQNVTTQEQADTHQEQSATAKDQTVTDEEQSVGNDEQSDKDKKSFWDDHPILTGIFITVAGGFILCKLGWS